MLAPAAGASTAMDPLQGNAAPRRLALPVAALARPVATVVVPADGVEGLAASESEERQP
jgi:hypothetical protein